MADATVLIDLHAGGLLPGALVQPYQLVAPDLVVAELREPSGEALCQQGLQRKRLTGADVAEMVAMTGRHPRALSTMDLAALVLAKRLQVPLLTGERLLRRVAGEEDVVVHGTLWLLDRMIATSVTTKKSAACALGQMLVAGSRSAIG